MPKPTRRDSSASRSAPRSRQESPLPSIPPRPSRPVPSRQASSPAATRTPGDNLRGAAWESKWQALEADLQEAVLDQREGLPALPDSPDRGSANQGSKGRQVLSHHDIAAAMESDAETEGVSARSIGKPVRGTPCGTPRETSIMTAVKEPGGSPPASARSAASQESSSSSCPSTGRKEQHETSARSDEKSVDSKEPLIAAAAANSARSDEKSEDSKEPLIPAGAASVPRVETKMPELVSMPSPGAAAPVAARSGQEASAAKGGLQLEEALTVKVRNIWDNDDQHDDDPMLGLDDGDFELEEDQSQSSLQEVRGPTTVVSPESVMEKVMEATRNSTTARKGMRSVHRLWCTLVLLSVLELGLMAGSTVADHLWSPCREKLASCEHLHVADCQGTSCIDCAPFWASAWPTAGLVFLAWPMRRALSRAGVVGLQSSSLSTCPKALPLLLMVSLAVLGTGAAVLVEVTLASVYYASRCPMQRAASRCTADICPSPPCRRESSFSPCVCGLLGEAELARALFLKGFPACQPYEWYTRQMAMLEEMVLRYESFACVAGPLTCTATAVGGALFLVQLACCPLLLIGQWGGSEAILVLLGSFEDLDTVLVGDRTALTSSPVQLPGALATDLAPRPQQIPPPLHDQDLTGRGVQALGLPIGGSRQALLRSGSSSSQLRRSPTGRSQVAQRRTFDGDVSPDAF